MKILPFSKAHAVGNDFLIVEWSAVERLGLAESDLGPLARRMCDRRLAVGADGVEYVFDSADSTALIRLYNSDASEAEISGNGTRCVAAWLTAVRGSRDELQLETAAGVKKLTRLSQQGAVYVFDMEMGAPRCEPGDLARKLELNDHTAEVTVVDVGNPQCVLFVNHFGADWRTMGRAIETHPEFPNRTNVSFVRVLDEHTIDVRFWERGAGETLSSGTGATGAVAASILRGKAVSPVTVQTPAGEMNLRWDQQIVLRGPAELIADGEYRVPDDL